MLAVKTRSLPGKPGQMPCPALRPTGLGQRGAGGAAADAVPGRPGAARRRPPPPGSGGGAAVQGDAAPPGGVGPAGGTADAAGV